MLVKKRYQINLKNYKVIARKKLIKKKKVLGKKFLIKLKKKRKNYLLFISEFYQNLQIIGVISKDIKEILEDLYLVNRGEVLLRQTVDIDDLFFYVEYQFENEDIGKLYRKVLTKEEEEYLALSYDTREFDVNIIDIKGLWYNEYLRKIKVYYDFLAVWDKVISFKKVYYLKFGLINGEYFLKLLSFYSMYFDYQLNKRKEINIFRVEYKKLMNKKSYNVSFSSYSLGIKVVLKGILLGGYVRWFAKNSFEKLLYRNILLDWQTLNNKSFSFNLISIGRDELTSILLLKYVRNLMKRGYTLMESVGRLKELLELNKRWIQGIVLRCKGRFTRKERAFYSMYKVGKVSFGTVSMPIDYYSMTLILKYGSCNLTLWMTKYER